MKFSNAPYTPAEAEIYADLVETLFDTTHTLVTGILSGLLVPVVAWLYTSNRNYLVLAGLMAALGAVRLNVLWAHQRAPFTSAAPTLRCGKPVTRPGRSAS
ncbi:hypothetical protein WOA01_14385 [Methylocystis sp. IM2]|uniref:hypothetical protein n=1 Tax=unclassified Methylocystis TaxID=2625913 RepID=UPI0030FC7784